MPENKSEEAGREEENGEKENRFAAQARGEAQDRQAQSCRSPDGVAPGRHTRRVAVPDGQQALGICRAAGRQIPHG